MIVPINKIDQEQQQRILKTPASRGEIGPASLLAVDLIDTARSFENCVGLASNQIWVKPDEPIPHVFIALVGGFWKVFINATSKRFGSYLSYTEACMSKPGYKHKKTRRAGISLSFFDEEGRYKTERFTGMDAIIIQHELDHMSGTLI
jgi:peptide deformylase